MPPPSFIRIRDPSAPRRPVAVDGVSLQKDSTCQIYSNLRGKGSSKGRRNNGLLQSDLLVLLLCLFWKKIGTVGGVALLDSLHPCKTPNFVQQKFTY